MSNINTEQYIYNKFTNIFYVDLTKNSITENLVLNKTSGNSQWYDITGKPPEKWLFQFNNNEFIIYDQESLNEFIHSYRLNGNNTISTFGKIQDLIDFSKPININWNNGILELFNNENHTLIFLNFKTDKILVFGANNRINTTLSINGLIQNKMISSSTFFQSETEPPATKYFTKSILPELNSYSIYNNDLICFTTTKIYKINDFYKRLENITDLQLVYNTTNAINRTNVIDFSPLNLNCKNGKYLEKSKSIYLELYDMNTDNMQGFVIKFNYDFNSGTFDSPITQDLPFFDIQYVSGGFNNQLSTTNQFLFKDQNSAQLKINDRKIQQLDQQKHKLYFQTNQGLIFTDLDQSYDYLTNPTSTILFKYITTDSNSQMTDSNNLSQFDNTLKLTPQLTLPNSTTPVSVTNPQNISKIQINENDYNLIYTIFDYQNDSSLSSATEQDKNIGGLQYFDLINKTTETYDLSNYPRLYSNVFIDTISINEDSSSKKIFFLTNQSIYSDYYITAKLLENQRNLIFFNKTSSSLEFIFSYLPPFNKVYIDVYDLSQWEQQDSNNDLTTTPFDRDNLQIFNNYKTEWNISDIIVNPQNDLSFETVLKQQNVTINNLKSNNKYGIILHLETIRYDLTYISPVETTKLAIDLDQIDNINITRKTITLTNKSLNSNSLFIEFDNPITQIVDQIVIEQIQVGEDKFTIETINMKDYQVTIKEQIQSDQTTITADQIDVPDTISFEDDTGSSIYVRFNGIFSNNEIKDLWLKKNSDGTYSLYNGTDVTSLTQGSGLGEQIPQNTILYPIHFRIETEMLNINKQYSLFFTQYLKDSKSPIQIYQYTIQDGIEQIPSIIYEYNTNYKTIYFDFINDKDYLNEKIISVKDLDDNNNIIDIQDNNTQLKFTTDGITIQPTEMNKIINVPQKTIQELNSISDLGDNQYNLTLINQSDSENKQLTLENQYISYSIPLDLFGFVMETGGMYIDDNQIIQQDIDKNGNIIYSLISSMVEGNNEMEQKNIIINEIEVEYDKNILQEKNTISIDLTKEIDRFLTINKITSQVGGSENELFNIINNSQYGDITINSSNYDQTSSNIKYYFRSIDYQNKNLLHQVDFAFISDLTFQLNNEFSSSGSEQITITDKYDNTYIFNIIHQNNSYIIQDNETNKISILKDSGTNINVISNQHIYLNFKFTIPIKTIKFTGFSQQFYYFRTQIKADQNIFFEISQSSNLNPNMTIIPYTSISNINELLIDNALTKVKYDLSDFTNIFGQGTNKVSSLKFEITQYNVKYQLNSNHSQLNITNIQKILKSLKYFSTELAIGVLTSTQDFQIDNSPYDYSITQNKINDLYSFYINLKLLQEDNSYQDKIRFIFSKDKGQTWGYWDTTNNQFVTIGDLNGITKQSDIYHVLKTKQISNSTFIIDNSNSIDDIDVDTNYMTTIENLNFENYQDTKQQLENNKNDFLTTIFKNGNHLDFQIIITDSNIQLNNLQYIQDITALNGNITYMEIRNKDQSGEFNGFEGINDIKKIFRLIQTINKPSNTDIKIFYKYYDIDDSGNKKWYLNIVSPDASLTFREQQIEEGWYELTNEKQDTTTLYKNTIFFEPDDKIVKDQSKFGFKFMVKFIPGNTQELPYLQSIKLNYIDLIGDIEPLLPTQLSTINNGKQTFLFRLPKDKQLGTGQIAFEVKQYKDGQLINLGNSKYRTFNIKDTTNDYFKDFDYISSLSNISFNNVCYISDIKISNIEEDIDIFNLNKYTWKPFQTDTIIRNYTSINSSSYSFMSGIPLNGNIYIRFDFDGINVNSDVLDEMLVKLWLYEGSQG